MGKKYWALLIGIIIIATAAISIMLLPSQFKMQEDDFLVKEPSYNPNGICDALTPSCGYCPGQIVNNECLVKK